MFKTKLLALCKWRKMKNYFSPTITFQIIFFHVKIMLTFKIRNVTSNESSLYHLSHTKNRICNWLFHIYAYRFIKDVSGDVHVRDCNGLPAYLINRKCFVTLMPSISAFSAEREIAIATELKFRVIDHTVQLLDY